MSTPRAHAPANDAADVDGYRAFVARRNRRIAVTNEALGNPDIVACILRGNVGPSTFAVASEVSHVWRTVCRSDATVLRAVALYQGGLTRAKLTHLFAITANEAKALPCSTHARHGGGVYYVYRAPAVDALLSPRGGMKAWRLRLRARAESPWSPFELWPPPPCPARRAHWQEEDRLHAVEAREAL